MSFVLPVHCHETTRTTGTSPYELEGAVATFLALDSQANDGDETFYCAWLATSPPQVEWGRCVYSSGPPRTISRVVLGSTNGGSPVVWGTGEKNVVFGLPGVVAASIFGTPQTPGILARTADHIYTPRSIVGGLWVGVNDGDGVGGNPTLDDSALNIINSLLWRTGGTDAQRTMSDMLTLANALTMLSGIDGAQRHTFRHAAAGPDNIFDVEKIGGASDWALRVWAGGNPHTVWHSGNDGDNSGLDAHLVQGFDFDDPTNFDWTGQHYSFRLPLNLTGSGPLAVNFGYQAVSRPSPLAVTLADPYTTHLVAVGSCGPVVSSWPTNPEGGAYPLSPSQVALQWYASGAGGDVTRDVYYVSMGLI